MKIKIKKVNDMAVTDDNFNIIIIKKPNRRYRTIIKTYYKHHMSNLRKNKIYNCEYCEHSYFGDYDRLYCKYKKCKYDI